MVIIVHFFRWTFLNFSGWPWRTIFRKTFSIRVPFSTLTINFSRFLLYFKYLLFKVTLEDTWLVGLSGGSAKIFELFFKEMQNRTILTKLRFNVFACEITREITRSNLWWSSSTPRRMTGNVMWSDFKALSFQSVFPACWLTSTWSRMYPSARPHWPGHDEMLAKIKKGFCY